MVHSEGNEGLGQECNPCHFGKIKRILLVKLNFSTYIFLSKQCILLLYVKITSLAKDQHLILFFVPFLDDRNRSKENCW